MDEQDFEDQNYVVTAPIALPLAFRAACSRRSGSSKMESGANAPAPHAEAAAKQNRLSPLAQVPVCAGRELGHWLTRGSFPAP